MIQLDCRNLQCPHPVVATRKQMLENPVSHIRVQVGDEMARENVSRLATSQGYQVEVKDTEYGFALELIPGEKPAVEATAPAQGKTVLYIGSDSMGSGDDELGRLLLKNYLFTLTEMEEIPDSILFVNSGVKLACEGSEAIEALNDLACKGADLASCGLCLDFYTLKDKLLVGRVTNMLEIAESQQKAGRLIRP